MQDVKAQLVSKLKEANSVLVCVSNNPSVDQLSATLALTLILNKLGKHATAVFSGEVPNTLSFLNPESTIKKDTNSLQDFIISLDKEKADKLRYKVEDQFVKIFITPYNTAISEKDLEFGQGEVNVDVVVALGVHAQQDLDKAIAANGRILHDATVISITTVPTSTLGSINWSNEKSSSLCEMLVDLTSVLTPTNVLDSQIANALLSGIVAETDRFSNEKTSASTMSISSNLLQLGANQQLVASKISPERQAEKPTEKVKSENEEKKAGIPVVEEKDKVTVSKQEESSNDLKVEHTEEKGEEFGLAQVHIDEHGNITSKSKDTSEDNVPPKVDTSDEDVEEEKDDPLRRPEKVINPIEGENQSDSVIPEAPIVNQPGAAAPIEQTPPSPPVSIIHTEVKENEQVTVKEPNRPAPPPVPPPILPPKQL